MKVPSMGCIVPYGRIESEELYTEIKAKVMRNLILLILITLFVADAHGQTQYWTNVLSGTNKRLCSVSFGSESVGYIGGEDSLLLKTTDGGATWQPVAHAGMGFSLVGTDIIHVNFLNDSVGFAVVGDFEFPTYLGTMYKTSNGGLTWTHVQSGNIAVYSTYFFDEHNGYQVGSAFFAGRAVIKQTNGIWSDYHTFSWTADDFLYTVDFYDSLVGIAGGSMGYVFRTMNGGVTWDTVKTVVDSNIYSLKFVDHRTVLAATGNNPAALIISTDTGRTWQLETNTMTFAYPALRSLTLSKRDSFIAVGKASFGDQGVLLSWLNGSVDLYMSDHPLNSVSMSNDSVAFAVGDSGLIVSNRHFLLPVRDVEEEEYQAEVFPNPTTGRLVTRMDGPHEVSVTDMQGRVLHRQTDRQKQHNLKLSGLPAGIYIVELKTEDGVRVTRKIVIQ